jgi:hypothetical protein
VVWVTPEENNRLPFPCYITAVTRRNRDPDALVYLQEKWYCLRVDSNGKAYIGARRTEIENEILQELARQSVENPPTAEEERATSPDSINEPEKRQTAPVPKEITMGTSTRVEVQTEAVPTTSSNPGKKPARSDLKALLDKAMKRSGPPDDDPDYPEEGNDDDEDDLYHDAFPAAVPTGPDGKVLGNLPSPFTGDRSRADEFLTNMQAYFRLNIKNAQIRSPMTRVAMCLSTMEGPDVEEWKRDVGKWFDRLNPDIDDRPGVWLTFEEEFKKQFEDSQREPRARMELQELEMKWPLIDKYVSDFEKLARMSGYNHTNPETMHYFMGGLPKSILTDVLRPPVPLTYHKMKSKAVEAVRSRVLIDTMTKGRTIGNRPMTNLFPSRNQRPQTSRPFSNQPRFNSTTAPPSYNNRPVPMDLGRGKAPRPPRQYVNASQDGNQPRKKGNLFQLRTGRTLRQRMPPTKTSQGKLWLVTRRTRRTSTSWLGLRQPTTTDGASPDGRSSRRPPSKGLGPLPRGQRATTPELRSTDGRNERIGFLNALICAAWIRSGTDDRVYLSLRKSMTIKAYIHTASKRAEVESLLDSGATENFISEDLAYRMRTPIIRLHKPRPLFNIDGTKNRKGRHYAIYRPTSPDGN